MMNFKLSRGIATPSKFTPGVALLWQGISLRLINKIIYKVLFRSSNETLNKTRNEFLFRSARSAITAILKSRNIGKGKEVIISSFTCSALTNAVISAGATPVYVDILDDLTMDINSIKEAINMNTGALIVQNTFGRKSISKDDLNSLTHKKLVIIDDNCLSFGSKYNGNDIGINSKYSVSSLEASKSFTLGWGGIVKINDKILNDKFRHYYSNLKRVNLVKDFKNLFQLWLTIFLQRYSFNNGFILWYLFYGTRLFKISKTEDKYTTTKHIKMGFVSELIYNEYKKYFDKLGEKSNHNYLKIQKKLISLGIEPCIIEKENEFIVSPRISFRAPISSINRIKEIAHSHKIEISRWFKEAPPIENLTLCKKQNLNNCSKISLQIINIPCFWSYNSQKIRSIESFLDDISPLVNNP